MPHDNQQLESPPVNTTSRQAGGGVRLLIKIKKTVVCFSSENIIACLLTLIDTLPSGRQNMYNLSLLTI